jgi:tetratricopeptide (TPR) repeat protein
MILLDTHREGAALLRQKNWASASPLLSKALRLFPNCADVWIQYAEVFMQRAEWITASVYWGLARESFPEQIAPYVRGVNALAQLGWIAEAEVLMNRAYIKFKDNVWVAHAYADFPVWRQDLTEAIFRWDALRKQFGADVAGYIRTYELLAAAGRERESHVLAREGAAQFPDDFSLGQLAALADVRQGNASSAIGRWAALRASFPNRPEAWIGEAHALRIFGKAKEAWMLLSYAGKSLEVSAHLAQQRLEIAIDLGQLVDASAIWAEIQNSGQGTSEKFFQETWRLYVANIGAASSKPLIDVLLDEPDRKREGWLPQLAIGLNALLSNPEMFSQVRQEILQTLALKPKRSFRQMNLARAMIDESAEEALFHELLELYSASGLRQLIYVLFCSVNRQAVGLQDFQVKARDYLRAYIDLQASKFVGDPGAFDENQAYSLFVLAYVFFRQRFHEVVTAAEKELADVAKGSAKLRAAWGDAFSALSSICHETIANAPLLWRPMNVKSAGRRLKIALCVSGQLRGFQLAKPTWCHLGLQAHDVTTIVHTWANIGRRFPDPSHCSRVFSGHFLTAYVEISRLLDTKSLMARYPGFFAFFKNSRPIDSLDLQSFYQTEHVVIEDDNESPYADYTNSMKMHYKIEAAHEYACLLNHDYDLMIRIRPDKSIRGARAFDWESVSSISREERRLFCDMPPTTSPPGYFEIGDQFAVGAPSPMAAYARAWSITRDADAGKLYGMPRGYRGHVNLATSTLHSGVMVDHFQFIDFGAELDPDRPTCREIFTLLQNDIEAREADATDRALLAAAELDCNV